MLLYLVLLLSLFAFIFAVVQAASVSVILVCLLVTPSFLCVCLSCVDTPTTISGKIVGLPPGSHAISIQIFGDLSQGFASMVCFIFREVTSILRSTPVFSSFCYF